ncbi:CRIB domain-containing protein RIC8 [Capsella rubella]|nr:CRIB domain-containing protein RIC8 [Capsella rubella]
MQIGTPTDVKHIAHIGWDGGSLNQNSPTWMSDFNLSGGYSSVPLRNIKEDASCLSEESSRRSRETHGLPKASRERSSTNLGGSRSPTKEGSSRLRGSSHSSGNPKASRKSKESYDTILQDGSKRSRRRKSKDSVNGGGSSRSSRRARGSSQSESMSGSISDTGSMISIDLHL